MGAASKGCRHITYKNLLVVVDIFKKKDINEDN